MTTLHKRLIIISCLLGLAACETPTPSVPVQPVAIVSSDFCEIVDKSRDLSWSIQDTKATITNLRRLAAKWDSRCLKRK